MDKYDNDDILEMCSKIDLLDYASNSLKFEQKGENYVTNCPKHIDKTPSLSITPSKNLYHCFSCGIGGNILNWIIDFEGLKFYQALEKVAKLTGTNIKHIKQSDALIWFKKLKREQETNPIEIYRDILSDNIFNSYIKDYPKEWLDEGIESTMMDKYNIMIDTNANRIVYPIYDNDLNLIGIKGRTRYKNYKELKLQKYMNYQKIGTTNFFVGMRENKDNIIKKDEVIIFEGIKSGMKAEGWGFDNWLSSETSCLNNEQVKILIKLKVKDVIIAYDNDVELSKIKDCTNLLKKFTNVYYIYDKFKKLGKKEDKMSPVDKGKDVWIELYNERVKLK